jgi:hypothetical protein
VAREFRGVQTSPRSIALNSIVALATAAMLSGAPLPAQQASAERSGAAKPPGSGGVEITAALQQEAFRDYAASPMIYRGVGGTLVFGYSRHRPTSRFGVELGVGYAGLSPPDADISPTARDFSARLALSRLRRLGSSGAEWFAGPMAAADVSARVHQYSDPNRTEHLFGHARVSVGAALRAESRPSSRIAWTQELRTPLIHWAAWPYSTPTMRDRGKLEVIGFNRLRGVEELFTIGSGTWSWTYRFTLLHADDAAARRYARHEIGTKIAFARSGGP